MITHTELENERLFAFWLLSIRIILARARKTFCSWSAGTIHHVVPSREPERWEMDDFLLTQCRRREKASWAGRIFSYETGPAYVMHRKEPFREGSWSWYLICARRPRSFRRPYIRGERSPDNNTYRSLFLFSGKEINWRRKEVKRFEGRNTMEERGRGGEEWKTWRYSIGT